MPLSYCSIDMFTDLSSALRSILIYFQCVLCPCASNPALWWACVTFQNIVLPACDCSEWWACIRKAIKHSCYRHICSNSTFWKTADLKKERVSAALKSLVDNIQSIMFQACITPRLHLYHSNFPPHFLLNLVIFAKLTYHMTAANHLYPSRNIKPSTASFVKFLLMLHHRAV